MNDPYFEMLIHEYKEFSEMLEELLPILKNDREALQSWAKYTQFFCIALIMHVDPGKAEHRAFCNNVVFPGGPELSTEEYRELFDTYSVEDIDACLFRDHRVTQTLVDYDAKHGSHYFTKFISYYHNIAEIFADQSVRFRAPVERFVKEYEESADAYWASNGLSWGKTRTPSHTFKEPIHDVPSSPTTVSDSRVQRTTTEEVGSTQTKQYSYHEKLPEVDKQFWVRILIPLMAGGSFILAGLIGKSIGLLIVGIVGLVIFGFGIKANNQRCPNCRAWNSMTTIKSEKVGEKKVKVRRNLNSTYYRTSGNTTFGTRQVFVSADEVTYKEVYRCVHCGYEMRGTRRVIDDGIR